MKYEIKWLQVVIYTNILLLNDFFNSCFVSWNSNNLHKNCKLAMKYFNANYVAPPPLSL